MDIKTAEQLLQDIKVWLETAQDSQLDRLTEINMRDDLSKEQKRDMAREIMNEKYDAQAIINNLKPIVTWNGSTYELPKRATLTRTVSVNPNGKAHEHFKDGDKVKYVRDGIESEVLEVIGGKLRKADGTLTFPNTISAEVIATAKGMSVEDYKAWYLAEHGRPFTGVQGLSDVKHWVKQLSE